MKAHTSFWTIAEDGSEAFFADIDPRYPNKIVLVIVPLPMQDKGQFFAVDVQQAEALARTLLQMVKEMKGGSDE